MSAERVSYWRWLWAKRQWWFLRALPPSEWETVIFTGLPGAGKTTFGVDMAVRYMRRGITVYSNVYIRDTYTGQESRPVLNWVDVLRASVEGLESGEPCMIYLTEIQLMCDARNWQKTPSWWSEMMQQRRHMGLGLMADTQHLSQVEKRLRMLIGRVVQIQPSLARRVWRRVPLFAVRDVDLQVGDDPAQWTPPGKPRWVWLRSHAFHSHATWELLAGQDFGDLSDEMTLEVVEGLRQRAIACNAVSHLPSYADDRDQSLPPEGFYRVTPENGVT